ncbi:MAG: helix-turn-helix transcriptional regulator [Bacteroidota bacterium]
MVNERLLKLMEQEKISAARLADILEVQPSAISHILSGRNKPSFDFLQKIALKFPRLNVDWLITGKGNMYKVAIQQSLFDTVPPQATNTSIQSNSIPENLSRHDKVTGVNIKQSSRIVKQIFILYNDNTFDIYSPAKPD